MHGKFSQASQSLQIAYHFISQSFASSSSSTMSDKCVNCDCSDSSQCVKKGNQYGFIIETENIYEAGVMGAPVTENDGRCKCGSSCSAANCSCGCH
ncbi:hypothetical protein Nepgr_026126 [Nepenthes gracilis]|uniref:Uncharacterized protein n=1 Tax=Nepenthes gracilis TaxID=150966 RepID=A0AAD3Y0B0_NEPGR|nr:hypothetical protein Nepgr_026126 [Nepenthes gracilis]